MSKAPVERFVKLWSEPGCEDHRLSLSSRWINQFTSRDLVDCVTWWTYYVQTNSISLQVFQHVLAIIILAWSPKNMYMLRRHLIEERQIIDRKTMQLMPVEERERLVAISSWIVSVLLKDPLRT